MTELKLCPFCGSEAKTFKSYDGRFVAQCKNPDCGSKLTCGGYGYDTEERAAEAWNRRTHG